MASHVYPSDLSDDEWALLFPIDPIGETRWSTSLGGDRAHLRAASSTCCAVAVCGVICRASMVRGPPSPPIGVVGASMAPSGSGSTSTPSCVSWRASAAGRGCAPSVAIIESQSVKTTEQGGPMAWMAPSRSLGARRHLLVDIQDLLLKVVVHPASLHDRIGAKLVLGTCGTAFPRLQRVRADQGDAEALQQWRREQLGIELEVISPWWRQLKRSAPEVLEALGYRADFNVLPRPWVVERSIARLGRSRRLSITWKASTRSVGISCSTVLR